MVNENRKERRIRVSLPVRIIHQNVEIRARIENISRLGAYAEIGQKISPGAGLDITLKIPACAGDLSLSGEVRCKGTVFRSNLTRESNSKKYYGTGIFFTSFLQQADKDKLSRYIGYLILQDEQGIREGVKRWKKKRRKGKAVMPSQGIEREANNYSRETLGLLKEVLSRLEEIHHLLKSQNKTQ